MLLISLLSSSVMLLSLRHGRCTPSQPRAVAILDVGGSGKVLVCSCCSSEAPRTSPQDKHSLSSGMWLLLLYTLSASDGWQPSVGCVDTLAQMSRRARRRLRRRRAAYRGSSDSEIKGLWKVHRVSSVLSPRRRPTVCVWFFLCVFYAKESVPTANQPCTDVYYDRGQCWFNHTLATTASHDDPPDRALRPTRVPWEGGGGVECDSQYFE